VSVCWTLVGASDRRGGWTRSSREQKRDEGKRVVKGEDVDDGRAPAGIGRVARHAGSARRRRGELLSSASRSDWALALRVSSRRPSTSGEGTVFIVGSRLDE